MKEAVVCYKNTGEILHIFKENSGAVKLGKQFMRAKIRASWYTIIEEKLSGDTYIFYVN